MEVDARDVEGLPLLAQPALDRAHGGDASEADHAWVKPLTTPSLLVVN